MPSIARDLDRIQLYLRDRPGTLWTRPQLLRHYADGYRRLLALSQGIRHFVVLPIPPQYAYAYAYLWERHHTDQGTARKWSFGGPGAHRQCTTLWELEENAVITASNAHYPCVTALWELGYASGVTDSDYRFALPRQAERIKAVYYDHLPLTPLASRALDALETGWNRAQGEPWVWVPGYGESRSFEVYHVRTQYSAVYAYRYDNNIAYGLTRSIDGDRTYTHTGTALENGYAYTTHADAQHLAARAPGRMVGFGLRITHDETPNPGGRYQATQTWEQERHLGQTTFTAGETVGTAAWEVAHGASNLAEYPVGLMREALSPERQYLATVDWEDALGVTRFWDSSAGNVLVHEAIISDVPDLTEDDTPTMIPPQLQKYLRYYVLYCCFAQFGETFRPDLAAHWKVRWERGPQLLRKLADSTFTDVQLQRQTRQDDHSRHVVGRAPYPPEYGAVRG